MQKLINFLASLFMIIGIIFSGVASHEMYHYYHNYGDGEMVAMCLANVPSEFRSSFGFVAWENQAVDEEAKNQEEMIAWIITLLVWLIGFICYKYAWKEEENAIPKTTGFERTTIN